jgi:PEGA domain
MPTPTCPSSGRRSLAGLVLALLASGPTIALAQPRDPAGAEAIFRDGQAAMGRGDFATACKKFEESQRLEPAPGTLFFLADCEEKRGLLATSWAHFQELLQKLPKDDPRRPNVVDRARALEPKIPKLTLRLKEDTPKDATVTRNGLVFGPASLGTPVPIDPGTYTIVVEAKGYQRSETTITIESGAKEIVVGVGPVDESAVAEHVSAGGLRVPLGVTIGGIGLAAVATGIGVGVAAKNDYDDSDRYCGPDDRCDPAGVDIRDSARTMGTAATVVFFVGVAATLGGTIVWLTAPRSEGGLASSGGVRVGFNASGMVVRSTW